MKSSHHLAPVLVIALLLGARTAAGITVENLTLDLTSCVTATISWEVPPTGPPAGISGFRVYRDGVEENFLAPGAGSTVTYWSPRWLDPETTYEYEVVVVDGNGVEEPDGVGFEVFMPICQPPPADFSTLVMLFDFPDGPPSVPSPAEVRERVFEKNRSPATYMDKASYGQIVMDGDVTPVVRMPQPRSYYCQTEQGGGASYTDCSQVLMIQDGVAAAAPVFPGLGGYAFYAYVFFGTSGAFTASSSLGPMGMRLGSISDDPLTVTYTFAHEIGHNLRMPHNASWSCASGPVGPSLLDLESGGCVIGGPHKHDPMSGAAGAASPLPDYAGYHKIRAGILGWDRVADVVPTSPGQTVWLDQLEKPSSGTKMLKIDLGNGYAYFVEYRKKGTGGVMTPIDKTIVYLKAGLPTRESNDPVVLALWKSTTAQMSLQPGDSFVDNHRDIQVSVVQKRTLGGGLHQVQVRVTDIGGGGCGLGAEIALIIWPLIALRARRARRR